MPTPVNHTLDLAVTVKKGGETVAEATTTLSEPLAEGAVRDALQGLANDAADTYEQQLGS